jgi:hypothetical protein
MNATTTIPSARELIEYVGEEYAVTANDAAKVFLGAETEEARKAAETYLLRSGVILNGDGTWTLPAEYEADPDGAVDAWADKHGIDHLDAPLDTIPAVPQNKPEPEPVTVAPDASDDEIAAALIENTERNMPEQPEPKVKLPPKRKGKKKAKKAEPKPVEPLIADGLHGRPLGDSDIRPSLQAQIDSLTEMVQTLQAEVEALKSAPKITAKKEKAPKKQKSNSVKKMSVKDMIEAGIISIGDAVKVEGSNGVSGTATLVSHRDVRVEADGPDVRINAWACSVTGWKSVNVYERVTHVESGKLLNDLRSPA